MVLAHEVRGRWSEEAWTIISLLPREKAETAPAALRFYEILLLDKMGKLCDSSSANDLRRNSCRRAFQQDTCLERLETCTRRGAVWPPDCTRGPL